MKLKSAFVACGYLICLCVVVALGLEYSDLRELVIIPIVCAMALCIILPACSIKE